MARRLIRVAQVHGDTAMPATEDVAANIYRWEHGKVQPSDRYRLYYCHTLGHPARPLRRPRMESCSGRAPGHHHHQPAEGTDTQIKLTSLDTPPGPGIGT